MTLNRRNLPDMKVLQTFESAARHGNFTRAAQELSLTQSAVSRQIRELEAQVGHPLFERLRGRVATTAAGAQLLPEVRRLLALAETTMRHATAVSEGETSLAINALPTFSARWLMPRIARYVAQNPKLCVDLTTRRDIFDFNAHHCDMAIHFGQPVWPGATCTYLCSEIVVPIAGGPLKDRMVRGPEDLIEAPKVHLNERPTLWTDWFARQDITLPQAHRGHWFDQFSLTIEAVKAGMGYALLPLYLIEVEVARGVLRPVLDMPHSTEQAYYIVIPEGRVAPVADLRDWLIKEVSFRPLEC